MNRVLLGMASANFVLVLITMCLGLLSDPPGGARAPAPDSALVADVRSSPGISERIAPQPTGELGTGYFRYHFELGLLTALFTILVHCLVFTYFLGTSRWVRETTGAYKLDARFVRSSQSCRASSMGVAIVGILLVVATVATGAGAHLRIWPTWLHQATPLATYAFMAYAYRVQYIALERHIALTDAIMHAVNTIRRARGLPVEERV